MQRRQNGGRKFKKARRQTLCFRYKATEIAARLDRSCHHHKGLLTGHPLHRGIWANEDLRVQYALNTGRNSFQNKHLTRFSCSVMFINTCPPRQGMGVTVAPLRGPCWDMPGGSVVKNPPPHAGTRIPSLVWEDSACSGATKPLRHN